jgi:hypothetical protein
VVEARGLRITTAGLVVACAVGVTTLAAAAPRWQVVPGANVDNEAVVWSAGRFWFLTHARNGDYVVRSGRVSGGRFSGWKNAKPALGPGNWVYQTGPAGSLYFTTSGTGGQVPQLVGVKLLANGELGIPAEPGGAATPKSSAGADVVQLSDRAVHVVGLPGSPPRLGVCCDANGKASDLVALIPPSTAPIAELGLDRRGRLWLAWMPGRQGRKQQARIVELDPATLKPRGQAGTVPGFRGFASVRALVCFDSCRLVAEGLAGRTMKTVSWARGDRAPTVLKLPMAGAKCSGFACASVIDARPVGDRLVVAYSVAQGEQGFVIATARGDKRGAGLRRIGSIREPARLGPFVSGMTLNSIPFGAFGPDTFGPVAVYSSGSRAVVRVASLRAR